MPGAIWPMTVRISTESLVSATESEYEQRSAQSEGCDFATPYGFAVGRRVLPDVELLQGIRPNRSRQELAEQTVIEGSQKKRFAKQNCCLAWHRFRDIACCSRA